MKGGEKPYGKEKSRSKESQKENNKEKGSKEENGKESDSQESYKEKSCKENDQEENSKKENQKGCKESDQEEKVRLLKVSKRKVTTPRLTFLFLFSRPNQSRAPLLDTVSLNRTDIYESLSTAHC